LIKRLPSCSGRPPGAYGAAAGHRPLLQAAERFRTGRPEIRRRRAVRSNAQAARSCPANVAGVAPHWSPRRHGRPTARRHRITAPIPGAFLLVDILPPCQFLKMAVNLQDT